MGLLWIDLQYKGWGALLWPRTGLVWLHSPIASEVKALLKLNASNCRVSSPFASAPSSVSTAPASPALSGQRLRQVEHIRCHQLGAGRTVRQELRGTRMEDVISPARAIASRWHGYVTMTLVDRNIIRP